MKTRILCQAPPVKAMIGRLVGLGFSRSSAVRGDACQRMTNNIERTDPRSILVPPSPYPHCLDTSRSLTKPYFFSACNMGDQSGSSRFQVLFESALQDYEKQTGITLANHPLAQQLQICQTVESITDLLHEQARALSEYRGCDKIMKSLKSVVSFLSKVASTATLGQHFGMVYPRQPIG